MNNFWSFRREYKNIKNLLLSKIDKTLAKGDLFFGKELIQFEKNFLKKHNSRYGIAVGSGTDALLISLKSIGIKYGDEVITAANTAIPTISAIVNSGAKPVLIDVGNDYLIDVSKIEEAITKKTKAIIPVHLYGQACEMNKIISIANKYNLKIIEDCAQAQGAIYKNNLVGTIGDFGCFSFYPTKILGAYGDGGFIITKKYNNFIKIKRIRFYGIETHNKKNTYYNKYYSNENGLNSRLDEIQCSILNLKLRYLDKQIERRKQIAELYNKHLKNTDLNLPIVNKSNKHVYHLYTVSHPKKKKIVKLLKKKKITTRVIYPYTIDTMKAFKNYNFNSKKISNAKKLSKIIFSLPLYPDLKNSEIKKICDEIKISLNHV
jgi:aminotransferase EvaB